MDELMKKLLGGMPEETSDLFAPLFAELFSETMFSNLSAEEMAMDMLLNGGLPGLSQTSDIPLKAVLENMIYYVEYFQQFEEKHFHKK